MKATRIIALLSALLLAASVQAREFADIYTDCGIGAIIAPNNDAVAAVTNVTFDLGTTAISSNSSSPDTCQGGKGSAAAFIYDAYPSIEKDLAVGHGEHLSALLTIMQCEASVQDSIALNLRQDFSTFVSAATYSENSRYENAEAMYNLLIKQVDTTYSNACAAS